MPDMASIAAKRDSTSKEGKVSKKERQVPQFCPLQHWSIRPSWPCCVVGYYSNFGRLPWCGGFVVVRPSHLMHTTTPQVLFRTSFRNTILDVLLARGYREVEEGEKWDFNWADVGWVSPCHYAHHISFIPTWYIEETRKCRRTIGLSLASLKYMAANSGSTVFRKRRGTPGRRSASQSLSQPLWAHKKGLHWMSYMMCLAVP